MVHRTLPKTNYVLYVHMRPMEFDKGGKNCGLRRCTDFDLFIV